MRSTAPRADDTEYIDLTELVFDDEPGSAGAAATVRVAEINRYEDLHQLTDLVYNGDLLLVDYSPLAGDELQLKRVSSELKNVVRDTGGDVAGIGRNMMLVTPAGVVIDRNKIRIVEE